MSSFSLLSWNVRGLNDAARRAVVCRRLIQHRCALACLQETKLSSVSDAVRREIVGPHLDGALDLFATGTRGGVMLLWHSTVFSVEDVHVSRFAITAKVTPVLGGVSWSITTVYGPTADADKVLFLDELVKLSSSVVGP
jgi:exonuclease III